MNNYGEWWNTTITLFNKVTESNGKVKWYKHIIEECFYDHSLDKVTVGNTALSSDVSVCRIKVSPDFVTKREYNKLSDRDRQDVFTLSVDDIIIPEESDFELDEYTKGKRASDLLKEYKDYPGCFTVKAVSVNVGGGRGNEHYLATG